MITPKEIKQKALRKYPAFLTACLQGASLFPLEIFGNKGRSNMKVEVLYASLKKLLEESKGQKGYGYEVELKEVNTRQAGLRSMPNRIYFSNQEDYLKWLGKNTEFADFLKQAAHTRRNLPQLMPFIEQQPLKLIKHLSHWPDLLKVIYYFLNNPSPNLYLRELPIEIHTKFIEQHKGIISELLTEVLPPEAVNQEETHFEKRYGLHYDEPVVRVRTLDKNLIDSLPDYLTDLSLPVSQFSQLDVKSKVIFIVENKQTFLSFPPQKKGLVIWGKGFALELLKGIPWLKEQAIFFWGDLDVQGFQMLHQLRGYFPQTKSLLMDKFTYDAFATFAVHNKNAPTVMDLSRLTDSEQDCYSFLCTTEKNRLEQEHISQAFLLKRLGHK